MKPTLLLVAALAAIPITAALAQNAAPVAAPPPPPTAEEIAAMTPEQLVNARESRMGQGGRVLASMKQVADSNGDLTTLAPRIERLVLWAETMPDYFREGSGGVGGTSARPEVWSDNAGFRAAAGRFAAASRALAAPAAANDREAFLARWSEARATCSACHDEYKN